MLVALRSPVRLNSAPRRDFLAPFPFLKKRFTPRTVFMEIGAADCGLALRAAGYVDRVYAVDVSGQFIESVLVPCNLRLVRCDGVHIPVPEESIDLAWSDAFMDHLHPDDAHEHLQSVRRSLVRGGEYLCRTNASPRELRRRLLAAGFSTPRYYAGPVQLPFSMMPSKLLRLAAIKQR